MAISVRPYQAEALEAIRSEWSVDATSPQKINKALVVLATGLGKTIVLASLPKTLQLASKDALLILAHRKELIKQTIEKISLVAPTLKVGIEKDKSKAEPDCDVIVASVQTLTGARLSQFASIFRDRIRVVAIDEAHHAVAQTYQNIVFSFPTAFVVGVTATPRRGDNVGLAGVFDRIVIHRDLEWGISHGWLVPLKSYIAKSNLDLSSVSLRGGDFAEADLGLKVNNDRRNALIVQSYLQHVPTKKSLVFTATVPHAHAVTREFIRRGIKAACASAKTSDYERAAIVSDFRRGSIQVLVNCGLYTEGFDVCDVEAIVNARPMRSAQLYAQITGRALRPVDEIANKLSLLESPAARCAEIARSRKKCAVIIDILDGLPRPGLQTLPTLWGLPPNFNAKGEDIRSVVKKYVKVAAHKPELAEAAVSVEEFNVALEEIDPFAPPIADPVVLESSKHNWLRVPGNAYRLSLPAAYIPLGTQPHELSAVRCKTKQLVRDAQSAGERNPIAYVEHFMGRKIATIEEWVEVSFTLLDRWEAKVYQAIFRGDKAPSERSQVLADSPQRIDAFVAADEWLKQNRTDFLSVTDTSLKWRLYPVSQNQKHVLMKYYNVPEQSIPATKGEANDLIVRLKAEATINRAVIVKKQVLAQSA